MDEAYRRLGHKLSQRVTSGEQYRVANVVIDLGSHPQSAFSTDDNNNNNNNTAAAGMHSEVSLENRDDPKIKLIDFGSACFEGRTSHTYIQSRFYRSPEVLVGLPYDSAIDMWSLRCVAAELFLGLPILPGVHEHDQLGRIGEMIARRKLLNVQKTREKQQALRRGFGSRHGNDTDRIDIEAHDRLRRGSDNTTSTGMFEGNG